MSKSYSDTAHMDSYVQSPCGIVRMGNMSRHTAIQYVRMDMSRHNPIISSHSVHPIFFPTDNSKQYINIPVHKQPGAV